MRKRNPPIRIRTHPIAQANNQFDPHLQVQEAWVSDLLRYVLRQEGSEVPWSLHPCGLRRH